MDDITFDAASYGRRRGLSNRAISEVVGVSTMMLSRAFKEHDIVYNLEAFLHKNPTEQNRVIGQLRMIMKGEATSEDFAIARGYAYVYDNNTLNRKVYVRPDGVSVPYIASIHALPNKGNEVR